MIQDSIWTEPMIMKRIIASLHEKAYGDVSKQMTVRLLMKAVTRVLDFIANLRFKAQGEKVWPCFGLGLASKYQATIFSSF